jgi:hypothetical protein
MSQYLRRVVFRLLLLVAITCKHGAAWARHKTSSHFKMHTLEDIRNKLAKAKHRKEVDGTEGHRWLPNQPAWTKDNPEYRSSAFPRFGPTNVLDTKIQKPWRAGAYRSHYQNERKEWIAFDLGYKHTLSGFRLLKPAFISKIMVLIDF